MQMIFLQMNFKTIEDVGPTTMLKITMLFKEPFPTSIILHKHEMYLSIQTTHWDQAAATTGASEDNSQTET